MQVRCGRVGAVQGAAGVAAQARADPGGRHLGRLPGEICSLHQQLRHALHYKQVWRGCEMPSCVFTPTSLLPDVLQHAFVTMPAAVKQCHPVQGEGLGAFRDIGALTMFADYRVPVVLRQMGLLRYSPSLAAKARPCFCKRSSPCPCMVAHVRMHGSREAGRHRGVHSSPMAWSGDHVACMAVPCRQIAAESACMTA